MATHEEKHRLAGTSSPSNSVIHSVQPPVQRPPLTLPSSSAEFEPSQFRPKAKPDEFQEGRFFCHTMLSKMHYFPEKPCTHGASCRLSGREHFHCDRCDFAYTSPLRLQTHLRKCQVQRPSSEPTPSSSPRPLLPKYPLNLLTSTVISSPTPTPQPFAHQNSIASSDSEQYDAKDSVQGDGARGKKLKFVTVGAPGQRNSGTQQQPIPEGTVHI